MVKGENHPDLVMTIPEFCLVIKISQTFGYQLAREYRLPVPVIRIGRLIFNYDVKIAPWNFQRLVTLGNMNGPGVFLGFHLLETVLAFMSSRDCFEVVWCR